MLDTHSTKIKKFFELLELNDNEAVLLYWINEMITEEEAMKILGVSRATLFYRWNKLKPKMAEKFEELSNGK